MKKNILIIAFSIISFVISPLYSQAFLNSNGPGNTFEEITYALVHGNAGDTSAVEDPQCVHPSFGRHIAEVWDAELGRYVFEFYSHVSIDNDRCINFDRQRVEIKTYDQSPAALKGVSGETIMYKWKFKIPTGFQPSPNFTHIHQIKAVGGDDADPVFTLTVRKGSPHKIELIHDNTTKVAVVNLSLFEGFWVECTEVVFVDSIHGKYSLTIKSANDGTILLSYSNNNLLTIRSDNSFIRPKWGIYRSLLSASDLRDESLRFSSFYIAENSTNTLPKAPSELKVSIAPVQQFKLSWKDNSSNEEFFRIERSNDSVLWINLALVEPNSTSYVDTTVNNGTSYFYHIRSENTFGNSSYSAVARDTNTIPLSVENTAPYRFFLSSNYPNPFNPTTTIEFTLPNQGRTTMKLYSLLGQELKTLIDEDLPPGIIHRYKLNAEQFPSGTYFYQLLFANHRIVKKMMLLK